MLTAADLTELPGLAAMIPLFPPPMMSRPWLAGEVVRFVGEPVVAIVAENSYIGADAAGAVAGAASGRSQGAA